MPQVFRGEGVPELMQKEVLAVWPFSAFVSVFGDTLTAIEASLLGNALNNHVHFAVGIAATVREYQLGRSRVTAGLELF